MKHSIKRIFSVLFSVMLVFFVTISPVSAKEKSYELDSKDYVYTIEGDYSVEDKDGNSLIFSNQEDLNLYLGTNFSLMSVCLPGDPGYPYCDDYIPTTETTTLVKTENLRQQFLGYNKFTPMWAKASNYDVTTSTSFSVSSTFKIDDISFTASASVNAGVVISIPANPAYYSRLGVLADITAKKYKVEVRNANTGQLLSTYYYATSSVTNLYHAVVYQ